MKDPKSFSRKLDTLLTKIGKDATHDNFISSIISELVDNFGKELQIVDGCIYDQRDKEFSLIYSLGINHWAKSINVDTDVIVKVRKHGSFIFDDPNLRGIFGLENISSSLVPAAFTIDTP